VFLINHSLCSCVSRANGLVNGNSPFLTPTESTSLNRSPKNCHRRDFYSYAQFGGNLSIGGYWWNITKIFYLFIVFIPLLRNAHTWLPYWMKKCQLGYCWHRWCPKIQHWRLTTFWATFWDTGGQQAVMTLIGSFTVLTVEIMIWNNYYIHCWMTAADNVDQWSLISVGRLFQILYLMWFSRFVHV